MNSDQPEGRSQFPDRQSSGPFPGGGHCGTEDSADQNSELLMRVHGDPKRPVLVYLPGLHGDWTLVGSFRAALAGRVRFVEFTYPRTTRWSLSDYGAAVLDRLSQAGIRRAWLLGESFGSQVVWPILSTCSRSGVDIAGIILAGGFVRHPVPPGVRFAARVCARIPMDVMREVLRVYAWYARFRHRKAPETYADLGAFLARRTEEDRWAAVHRLELIASADPRAQASACGVPVFYLAGLVDPLVPWWVVRPWLRRHCPCYAGGRTIWGADHNVLSTEPRRSADQIVSWMRVGGDSCLQSLDPA
jgi:pimeloyl-ACP methyl ester carboxylesterase